MTNIKPINKMLKIQVLEPLNINNWHPLLWIDINPPPDSKYMQEVPDTPRRRVAFA
jgi:hypothetical protein